MNHASKRPALPVLTADLLQESGILIDNVFTKLWQQIGMRTILRRAGFNKRSGFPIGEVIFTLSPWLWLKKNSIGMFSRVLPLGLSSEDGFVSLDNEIFSSQTKVQELAAPFKYRRSAVAKRHHAAVQHTKPEMVASMIRRSLRAGFEENYLLADAWFGSKTMIQLCQETALTAILRMKKNKMKYRVSECINDKVIKREMDVKALYQHSVRKQWKKIAGQKYQAKIIDVELNLAQTPKKKRNRSMFTYCLSKGLSRKQKSKLESTTGLSFCVQIQD